MSEKRCSNCRHFEEFSCRIRGVCTKFSRSTQVESSCGDFSSVDRASREAEPGTRRTEVHV